VEEVSKVTMDEIIFVVAVWHPDGWWACGTPPTWCLTGPVGWDTPSIRS
jgi:hypothetical protein